MGQGGSGGQHQGGLNQSRIVCGCEFWTSQREVIKASPMDKDEQLGQPVVPNGIPLSKIHHATFEAHLIGTDAEYRLHVSKRLLGRDDVRCWRRSSG
jgi:predicted restriction endonuclease